MWHRVAVYGSTRSQEVPPDGLRPRENLLRANLGKQGELFVARFRFQGKEYPDSI